MEEGGIRQPSETPGAASATFSCAAEEYATGARPAAETAEPLGTAMLAAYCEAAITDRMLLLAAGY